MSPASLILKTGSKTASGSAANTAAKTTSRLKIADHENSNKSRARRDLFGLLAVVAVASAMLFIALGDHPLFNPDEGYYAEPSREMLETGNWLTTTLNYAVRYTKPPLYYWASAGAMAVFGPTEFAARFWSAVCAVILIGATYCLVNRFVGLRAALIASTVLVSSPLFVALGRHALSDMPLSLLIAGGLFCFFRAYAERKRGFIWFGYTSLALAVLAKGPVGVALPVLVLLAYHLLRRNLKDAFLFYKPHLGALLVAAIALPWFIAETIATKGEYVACFIFMENLQRFTKVVSSHKGPLWYHFAVVAAGLLPWTLFLLQGLQRALKPQPTLPIPLISDPDAVQAPTVPPPTFPAPVAAAAEVAAKPRPQLTDVLNVYRVLTPRQDLLFFAACFVVVTIGFFSASVSKLVSYTAPCFPALAILVAAEIDALLSADAVSDNSASFRKRFLLPLLLFAAALAVTAGVAPFVLEHVRRAPPNIYPIIAGYAALQLAGVAIALGLAHFAQRRVECLIAFASMTLVSLAIFGYQTTHIVSDRWEGGMPELAKIAAASGEPIFAYRTRLPSLPFYTHRAAVLSPAQEKPIKGTNRFTGVMGNNVPPQLPWFGKPEIKPELNYLAEASVDGQIVRYKTAYVIARADELPHFQAVPGYTKVKEAGSFILLHWKNPNRPTP